MKKTRRNKKQQTTGGTSPTNEERIRIFIKNVINAALRVILVGTNDKVISPYYQLMVHSPCHAQILEQLTSRVINQNIFNNILEMQYRHPKQWKHYITVKIVENILTISGLWGEHMYDNNTQQAITLYIEKKYSRDITELFEINTPINTFKIGALPALQDIDSGTLMDIAQFNNYVSHEIKYSDPTTAYPIMEL